MTYCDIEHINEAKLCGSGGGGHDRAKTRRITTIIIGLLLVFLFVVVLAAGLNSSGACAISVDGDKLVWLVSEEEAKTALQLCLQQAGKEQQAGAALTAAAADPAAASTVSYSNKVTFVHNGKPGAYASVDEAAALLAANLDLTIKGVALQINGVAALYLADSDAAVSAVTAAKAKYGVAGVDGVSSVYTKEQISIVAASVPCDKLLTADQAAALLAADTDPLININVEKEVTSNEVIPYATTRVTSDELEVGVENLVSQGSDGEQAVTRRITELNGQVIADEQIGALVLTAAVDEVIEVGHAVVISSRSGSTLAAFVWPLLDGVGIVSSRFGLRSRDYHTGIDVANAYDTTIVASEGGTVSYAEYNGGGYGNLVIIDHGNGIETYYAHCNNIYVSAGDTVERGDSIATIGMTGTTTGPHVHFEIRIDDTPVDPLTYLDY